MALETQRGKQRTLILAAFGLLGLLPAALGCNSNSEPTPRSATGTPAAAEQGPTESPVNPTDFVREIDNPYLPLEPGTTFHYRGTTPEGPEETVVRVTHQTKEILGVRTTVVQETVTRNGEVIEDTRDWYAQDRMGNVWYFGEVTKQFENGEVISTEGSWEAGKDGAQPGIMMKARPKSGDRYQQENAPGVAEDKAEVLSLKESVTVPAGAYEKVLKTKDFTPLEPNLVENKYYARNVGPVLEVTVEGGQDRLELVRIDRP